MDVPAIDISAVPLLDTPVGLFGSLAGQAASTTTTVFEMGVTIILITHD